MKKLSLKEAFKFSNKNDQIDSDEVKMSEPIAWKELQKIARSLGYDQDLHMFNFEKDKDGNLLAINDHVFSWNGTVWEDID